MKTIIKQLAARLSLFFLFLFSYSALAYGQTGEVAGGPPADPNISITLKVGSIAPEIRYGTWLKGQKVDKLESGKIYVVEFWATWCGPCNAEMPHISELARQYQGKVTFASFDVWEGHGQNTPFVTTQSKVAKFVAAKGHNMDYNVATDSRDEFMAKNWLNTAGIRGIPTAFIIKDKQVVWIGHPSYLGDPLMQLVNGTYNLAASKQRINDELGAVELKTKQQNANRELITSLQKGKQWVKLVKAIDSIINANVDPKPKPDLAIMLMNLQSLKFKVLYKYISKQEALSYIKWLDLNSPKSAYHPGGIEETIEASPYNDETKESYEFILSKTKKSISAYEDKSGTFLLYFGCAQIYEKMGKIDEAVEYAQKGMDIANADSKGGKYAPFLAMQGNLSKLNSTLEQYKALQKEKLNSNH